MKFMFDLIVGPKRQIEIDSLKEMSRR